MKNILTFFLLIAAASAAVLLINSGQNADEYKWSGSEDESSEYLGI